MEYASGKMEDGEMRLQVGCGKSLIRALLIGLRNGDCSFCPRKRLTRERLGNVLSFVLNQSEEYLAGMLDILVIMSSSVYPDTAPDFASSWFSVGKINTVNPDQVSTIVVLQSFVSNP